MLENIVAVTIKELSPDDGPCFVADRPAIWLGDRPGFNDGRAHVLLRDVPLSGCDKTATALKRLAHPHLLLTDSTWHYAGGGCC